MRYIHKFRLFVFEVFSKFQAISKYPEDLKLDISEVISENRKIKVAVIDDSGFPYEEALESLDCVVKVYKKYTKDITQPGQKYKPISIGHPDIIFCDINGVGEEIYKDYQGLGVIEHLREKYPFTPIYAYTGTPQAVSNKLKDTTVIDGIFAKEWSIDDFLINFKKARSALYCPSDRWSFLRNRFKHLNVSERKIDDFRSAYVNKIIFTKCVKRKMGFSSKEILDLMNDNQDKYFDVALLTRLGIKIGTQVSSLFFPLLID